MRTLTGLVAAEIGVTILPASMRDSYQNVAYRELYDKQFTPQYDLAVAWRTSDYSPILQAFLAAARSNEHDLPVKKESLKTPRNPKNTKNPPP